MLYNKKNFMKTDDKKVLHKIGKHWVAISISALVALCGIAFSQTTSHANTIQPNNNISNSQTLKNRINQSIKATSQNNQLQSINSLKLNNDSNHKNNTANDSQDSQHIDSISQQANILHQRILSNAMVAKEEVNNSANPEVNSNIGINNQSQINNNKQINLSSINKNNVKKVNTNNQKMINQGQKNIVKGNNNKQMGNQQDSNQKQAIKDKTVGDVPRGNVGINDNVYLNPDGTMKLYCKTNIVNQDGTNTNQISSNNDLTPFTFYLTTADVHDVLSKDTNPNETYMSLMNVTTNNLPQYINIGNGRKISTNCYSIRTTGASTNASTMNNELGVYLIYNKYSHKIEFNGWETPGTNAGSIPYYTVNLVAKNAIPKITINQAIFDSGDNTNLNGKKGIKGSPMHWVINDKGQQVLSDMTNVPNLYNADNSIKHLTSVLPGQASYKVNIPASDNLLRPYDEIGDGVKIPDNLLDTNKGRKIDLSRIQQHSDCVLDTQDFSDFVGGTICKYHPNTTNPQPNNFITANNSSLVLPYLKYSGKSGLIVHYINQNNTEVSAHLVTAPQGTQINDITDTADGGVPVPEGYTLVPNQNVTYRLERYSISTPENVYLKVIGRPQSNTININRIIKKSDGTVTNSEIYNYKLDSNLNRVGNTIVLNPSDNDICPNGYIPNGYSLSNKKRNQQANNQNEDISIGNNLIDPSSITFYYHSIKQDSAPVYAYYINQNQNIVGGAYKASGNIGDTVNLLNNNPVPYGYSLTSSDKSRANVTLTNSPQVILYNVVGNTYSHTGTDAFLLHLIFKDINGHITKLEDVPIQTKGQVGDKFYLNPYHFKSGFDNTGKRYLNGTNKPIIFNGIDGKNEFNLPSNYHVASSDIDIEVSVTNNGDLSPTSNADFTYIRNFNQPEVGKVNIHYIVSDLNNKADDNDGVIVNLNGKKYHELDVESDNGVVDKDTFNVAPYLEDLPELVNKYYDISNRNTVMLKNGTIIPKDKYKKIFNNCNKSTYSNGEVNIYINLEKKGEQPIYL